MSTAKTLAKGSAWMIISLVIVKFFAWVYYVILARTVPLEEIGIFFLALSVMSIVGLFSDLGLGNGAVARYVPFYSGKGKFNHVKKVLKISIFVGGIFSAMCGVFIILFAGYISNFFHNPGLVPVFYIMALYLLSTNFYAIAGSFLQGRKLMKFVSYMASTQEISKLILTVLFFFLIGFIAESIAIGLILAYIFAAIIGWYWTLREYKTLPRSDEKVNSVLLLKEMVPFGLTMVLISSMGVINGYADRIIIGHLFPGETGVSMIGIYTIIIGFSTMIVIFGSAIGSIFYPLITELWAKKNIEEMNRLTIMVIRWIFITTTPLLLAVLIFSKQILTIIYGQNYSVGDIALILYSTGLFVFLLASPSQLILSAMRRLDVTTKIIAVGAVANVILNFIFIPESNVLAVYGISGINGAALASAVSFTIMTLLFIETNKITNIQIPKDIYKSIIAGLITVVLLFFLKPYMGEILRTLIPSLIPPDDIISEIISKLLKIFVLGMLVSVAFLIYLIFLIGLKAFHKEDVEILSGAMKRLKLPERWVLITERILLR